MTRTRRLVLNALIIAGFLCIAFVFAVMSVDSRIPELSYAAVVASVIVAASFAAHLAATLRDRTSTMTAAAGGSVSSMTKPNWRIASLWAFVTVSVGALICEGVSGSSAGERGLISTLGFALLIALLAGQAIRVARIEPKLHSS